MSGGGLQSGEIPAAILAWKEPLKSGPESDRLQRGLYELCCDAALKHGNADKPLEERKEEAMDLAHDFLCAIRMGSVGLLETKAGIKTAMSRTAIQRADPAARELWGILSDALRALAKEAKIQRTDADWRQNNDNDAQWSAAPGPSGKHPADVEEFDRRIQGVRSYYPKGAAGREPGKNWKVISPSAAKELALALLECTDGWVCMRHLLQAFKTKVHLFAEMPSVNDALAVVPDEHVIEGEERVKALAAELAVSIWKALQENNLTKIFCGYTVPKELRGESVKLESLGRSSTVFDKNVAVKKLLADFLDPDMVLEGANARWHGRLVVEVVELMADFCESSSGKMATSPLPPMKSP